MMGCLFCIADASVFKFIVAYSFVEFISAMMLYYIASNLSDNQYIYIDFPVVATVLLICRCVLFVFLVSLL
jgi:hypothetical protein